MGFRTIPYVGGNHAVVAARLRASTVMGHLRIACIGDSREDFQSSHGGKHSQYQINKALRVLYGSPSELPYVHMAYSIGSASAVQAYCQNSLHPYQGSAGPALSTLLPPRYPYFSTNIGQHSPLVQLLPWAVSRAATPAHLYETGALEFDPNRADIVCDVLLKKNAAGPNEIGWFYNPTNSTTQATFATMVSSGYSDGLELDADNTSVVKWTSPALAYQVGNPYAQVKVIGVNAALAAPVQDGQVWGMRFRQSTLSRGVSYTSFAIGGSLWDDWNLAIAGTPSGTVAAFGGAGPALALQGPFHMTRLTGGVNDYSGNTIDQIEADCRAFIAAWRTMLGDPNHQIILESPHMREGWPTVNYTPIIEQIADRYHQIATDTPNVAFYNVARALEDLDYLPNDLVWSGDAIHLGQWGDYQKALLVANMWDGQYSDINNARTTIVRNPIQGNVTIEPFDVATELFAESEVGCYFDASDLSTMFNNTVGVTGTIPASVGNTVALQLDKSKALALGPEIINLASFPTPGITNFGGSVGAWDATSRTMSNGTVGSNTSYPRFIFTIPGLVAGKYYRIQGLITQTANAVSNIRTQNAGLHSVPFIESTGVIDGYMRAVTSDFFEIQLDGTKSLPCSAAISNLSIREVLGNHRWQDTAASRPTLGRHPVGGIRNLLTNSETFSLWSSTAATVTSDVAQDPYGKFCVDRIADTAPAAWQSRFQAVTVTNDSKSYTFSFLLKKDNDETRFPEFGLDFSGGTSKSNRWFVNTKTGAFVGRTGFTNGVCSVTSYNTDFWEVRITTTNNASGNTTLTANIFPASGVTFGSLVNSAQGSIDVTWAMLVEGFGRGEYQRVGNTQFDVIENGKADCYYLSYDGVDDSMETNTIDFSTSDEMTIVTGIRKNSDAALACFLELGPSIATSNTLYLFAPVAAGNPSFEFASRGSGSASTARLNNSPENRSIVITCVGDISQPISQIRGDRIIAATNTANQGTGNYANQKLYFGRRAGSTFPFNGREYATILRGRTTGIEDLKRAERLIIAKASVDVFSFNYLINPSFAGAIAGAPGTVPTSWASTVAGGSFTTPAGALGFQTTSARQVISQTHSVVPGEYVFEFDVQVVSGSPELQDLHSGFSPPSGTTFVYMVNGVIVPNTTIVTETKRISACMTFTNSGTVQLRIGAGVQGNRTLSILIFNPTLRRRF